MRKLGRSNKCKALYKYCICFERCKRFKGPKLKIMPSFIIKENSWLNFKIT